MEMVFMIEADGRYLVDWRLLKRLSAHVQPLLLLPPQTLLLPPRPPVITHLDQETSLDIRKQNCVSTLLWHAIIWALLLSPLRSCHQNRTVNCSITNPFWAESTAAPPLLWLEDLQRRPRDWRPRTWGVVPDGWAGVDVSGGGERRRGWRGVSRRRARSQVRQRQECSPALASVSDRQSARSHLSNSRITG